MVIEIVECVFKVSLKIYKTVDEVQANKKRCQRLADRIRCLVTPLNVLVEQSGNGVVYKEALIDLARTLEEARQFLRTFIRGKSVLRKVQDVYYAKKVKDKFEDLNDRLNILVPALTFGLQVECRKSVEDKFSVSTRLTEDTKDESCDLKDIQQMINALGMPCFQSIRASEIREKRALTETEMYTLYTAKYRMMPVVVKRPRFDFTQRRREQFFNDAKNMLQFNSESVVRVFGICVDSCDSYLIIMEQMQLGSLRKLLLSDRPITKDILMRMCVECARGLYFVHCCDVIHRNLSSSKYLVNGDMHVKIAGFEFSGTESSVSGYKQAGSACCAPPDVALKDGPTGYTEKSDIYCYGVVLCEILTSRTSKYPCQPQSDSSCHNERHMLERMVGPCETVDVAKECTELDAMLRPSMEEVVQRLTVALEKL